MDAHQELLEPLFKATYGEEKGQKWWLNWRMYFIVCSETFGIKNGSEWGVEECSKCPFDLDHGLEVVEKAEDYIHEDERLCTDLDDDQCRFTFVYGYNNKTGALQVKIC